MLSNKKLSRIKKFLFFGIVGTIGVAVNTAALYMLTFLAGVYYLISSVIATELAIVSNFIGNHFFTFRNNKDPAPTKTKFIKFQFISIITIIGTTFLLWLFTSFFGIDRLILWNLAAISIMFVANFALNTRFTWREKKTVSLILCLFLFPLASAELVSVSQMAYHSLSMKEVIVYTSAPSGNFTVYTNLGVPVYSGTLAKPLNHYGNQVTCQGNNPCLVGYFTNLSAPGAYIVSTSFNAIDPIVIINDDTYASNSDIFFEFFKAQKQQDSPYHADFHEGYTPPLLAIADGSFIMESPQASKALIRLASAYNRNPALFDAVALNTIKDYVEYLKGLQGLVIDELELGEVGYENGFRLVPDMKIQNIFVPGPTTITSINIYAPDPQHTISDPNVPVTSLCGPDNGSASWQECIDFAATYYKCQINEPCVNASYIEQTGVVIGTSGYGVARGWSTEFGCFFDVTLQQEMFTSGQMNPCLVFYPEQTRAITTEALLGFLEALPALYTLDPAYANEVFQRAYQTQLYIDTVYPAFAANDPDAGYYGAALFLLYDYTGNTTFLTEAHAMRSIVTPSVSSVFISDGVRGPEFYWEEYARHKNALIAAGLQYPYQGKTAETLFQDKLFFDWKDRGELSISFNGERVFQFDPNIPFQNSRYILTEGLLAAKTLDVHPSPQNFVKIIADNQLAWMTGMNAIQEGTAQNAPVRSYSFIFGIAPELNPTQFHSRYLINSGFTAATNGELIGARGSGKQFFNGTDYVFLDGTFDILGQRFGAMGNQYNGESQTQLWDINQVFANGLSYIPGWINGAFDVSDNEDDIIFNYADTVMTYEFTETTNEMVATGVEYFAYADAYYNDQLPAVKPLFVIQNGSVNQTPVNITPATISIISPLTGTYNATNLLVNLNATGAQSVWFSVNGTNHTYGGPVTFTFPVGSSVLAAYANNSVGAISTASSTVNVVLPVTPPTNATNTTTPGTNTTNTTTGSLFVNNWTSVGVSGMYETDTAVFNVTLNGTGSVSWSVDGDVLNTTSGIVHSFSWRPPILYTSGVDTATVTATSGSNSVSWSVTVHNMINPFFDPSSGSSGSILHVFTNNNRINFANMSVTLQSTQGASTVTQTYTLTPTLVANNETDWKRSIADSEFDFGDNFLVLITARTVLNQLYQYSLATTGSDIRAFHKPLPASNNGGGSGGGSSGGGSGGGGGGGSSGGGVEQLNVVYTILDSEVIAVGEEQTITLDATSNRGVRAVSATFFIDNGSTTIVNLTRTAGTPGYGTWSDTFSVDQPGLYTLQSVTVTGQSSQKIFPQTGRAFYTVSELVGPSEELALIYSILETDRVDTVRTVNLTVDARDFNGVTAVSALVEKVRGDVLSSFTVDLALVSGRPQYGTWSGPILVDEADTTYVVRSITLSNALDSKTYNIEDRSIYATGDLPRAPGVGGSSITGSAIADFFKDPLKKPLFPFVFASFIVLLVLLGVIANARIEKAKLRKHSHNHERTTTTA